ncbi:MAG: hypothetical protein KJ906_03515 [Nanoarchaeota archaeon]|nr:hypothetical protein [Nanoarchaeota archaeon]
MVISKQALDLLYKLYRKKCFKKGHISVTNLLKSYRNNDMLLYKRALNELKQLRLIRMFPHGSELHVQMNTDCTKEILQIIEDEFNLSEKLL